MTADPLSVRKIIRIALVEDLDDVRDSWTRLIDGIPKFKCVCTCASGEEALCRLPEEQVDVVLMDIRLPRMSGIACTARLRPLIPQTQILILTVSADSDTIFRALEAGADGYLLKRCSPEDLQSERDAVLSTTQEDVRGFAPLIASAMEQNIFCAYGNADLLEAEQSLFRNMIRIEQG